MSPGTDDNITGDTTKKVENIQKKQNDHLWKMTREQNKKADLHRKNINTLKIQTI